MIPPRKYYIDLHYRGDGRIRIFCDRQGHALDSWHRASRVLESIRYEIDQHSFDSTKYVSANLKDFLFDTRIEAWYQDKVNEADPGNLSDSYTRVLRRYKDTYYRPFFKGQDIREIRTYHSHEFYIQLSKMEAPKNGKKKKSLKHIKNILNALENFFNTLHQLDKIDKKPRVPRVTLDRKTPKWVNRETQYDLLDAIRKEYRPIFIFLAFQGIRPGEARALKVKDFDLDNESFIVSRTFSDRKIEERVKSKVIRPRAINPDLVPMLRVLCSTKLPETFVFLNPRTGNHFSEDILFDRWEEARKKRGWI